MNVAILTISDRSALGEREDLSGPKLAGKITENGWEAVRQDVIPDDPQKIGSWLVDVSDSGDIDLILTTGGTGFSPRDHTPEATLAILDRLAPGLAEAMRFASLKKTPHAMLSRGVAGMRGKTLIVNLPGSPRGAVENLEVILPVLEHAVALLQDDPESESGHQIKPKPRLA